ncbi:Nn.00g033020.m01.CDS01 [Neocucurbitaria sp. VM-36]
MKHVQSERQATATPPYESSKESIEQMPMRPTSTKSIPIDNPEKQLDRPRQTSKNLPSEERVQDSTHSRGLEKAVKRAKALKVLKWFIQDQWFLLAMAAVVLVSSQVQVPASQQQIKRTVITYLSVSVIFFINGCTLETNVLVANYMRWKLHAFVQLQCYLVCSAATFAIVSLCATNPDFMDPWLLIGFLFIGSAPTTMSSNVVMTRQAHGNAALTVVQSVIGQFLCPFLTPIILQMYLSTGAWYSKVLVNGENYGEIYRRVFMQLGLSLFIPMCAGQVVQRLFPKQTKKIFFGWKLIKLSSISLLTLVWQTFDQAFQSGAFEQVKPSNIIFIVFISIALYFIWLAICFAASTFWLPKKDVIACCYCCPAKALAIIVPLSSIMYINVSPIDQSKMQIPAIIFQAFQVAIGGILTIGFRRWIRPEEQKEEADKNVEAGQEK